MVCLFGSARLTLRDFVDFRKVEAAVLTEVTFFFNTEIINF